MLFNIQRAQPLSAVPQTGNILVHKMDFLIQMNSMKKDQISQRHLPACIPFATIYLAKQLVYLAAFLCIKRNRLSNWLLIISSHLSRSTNISESFLAAQANSSSRSISQTCTSKYINITAAISPFCVINHLTYVAHWICLNS